MESIDFWGALLEIGSWINVAITWQGETWPLGCKLFCTPGLSCPSWKRTLLGQGTHPVS